MKFINRFEELKDLEEYYELSKRRLFSVAIYGQRRIGKTELIKKFYSNKKHIYFFVYEGKTRKNTLNDFTEELKRKGVIEKEVYFKGFDEFIDLLFSKCEQHIVIFDEVQYMKKIYPAFFSKMQRNFDENKDKKILFVFLGSIVGLMKKVFEDKKAPLYGRIKAKINLRQLTYADVRKMLAQFDYTEEKQFVEFFALFGGVPKYYTAIEDFELKGKNPHTVIERFLLRENAPLGGEVLSVLRQEFGSAKGYYYSILEAIATGHTKLSEISSYVGIDQTSLTSFLRDLNEDYGLISRKTPITKKKSKKGVYVLNNNFFKFWFRYIHRNMGEYEIGNYGMISKKIESEFNSFVGEAFEEVCKQLLQKLDKESRLPFLLERMGRWWGAYRDEHGERKTAEIDIIALNEKEKKILFGECKWSEQVNASEVLKELRKKTELVEWNKEKRKEYYVVFAKSFKKKFKENDVLLFDLGDLKKTLGK